MTNEMQTPASKPVAYCRECGKGLGPEEARWVHGTVYCPDHAPAVPASSAPVTGGSPALAFLLGLIPGVGAIYNGQYAKGLIHVVIFGLLITILSSGPGALEPLFALLLAGWYFYMPFEAYHTARKRQLGEPVDEFSSLFPLRRSGGHSLAAPLALIILGVLLLLANLGWLDVYLLMKYWPVLLIALGVYLLVERLRASRPAAPPQAPEASGKESHE